MVIDLQKILSLDGVKTNNMGHATPENKPRNESLYNDWKTGLRGKALGDKYGISRQAARKIAVRYATLDAMPDMTQENI